jgi:hypothetical protein
VFNDFNTRVFSNFYPLRQAVIAFVAVNPDNQLTFFNFGESGAEIIIAARRTMRKRVRQS